VGDLTGQVFVVTGGNGGIGLGMAAGLIAAGAQVCIWGRNEAKNETALARLNAMKERGSVAAQRCDVAEEAEVVSSMHTVVERFGRLDGCIANAGTNGSVPITEMTLTEWRRVQAVNLDGVFVTLREAAKHLIAQGEGGALVAVSSTSAIHGAPSSAHYAASKAGVLALVRSMAVALAREGIRVNALLPGWTKTDLASAGYANDRFRDATIRRTPVRRWAEPEEFGDVAAYLCDKALTFHTGDSVVVDGGYTIF
jgi:NAD(P)-dependent dehydrogenase (short-subunit alcohol dehydrogenase family)